MLWMLPRPGRQDAGYDYDDGVRDRGFGSGENAEQVKKTMGATTASLN